MAITKISDLNSLYNLIYNEALFVARESNVMTNLVTQLSANGFMARKVGKYAQVTAQAKAEGVDFANPTTFSKSVEATLTPGMVAAQVILTDEEMMTDPDGAQAMASRELGNAISTKIDTDLVGDFASFSTDKGPGAGSAATITKFATAISVLRNNKVPNPIYCVVHPYTWHDIWVLLGQPAANQALMGDIANQALRDFFVGRWINVLWFVDANITKDGNDDAYSGVFNPLALAFDSRVAPTIEPQRDASLAGTEINIRAGYAHGVWRTDFGVKYLNDVSEPT